ncbi:DUF6308 family protein [Amycolatopsis sp. NPDC047767]|uniref:DUF6308 family protein n=1 Tax=Amycolatopsis sp. NPDC047767 TaxID=3156765 RepID=UPI00345557D9
MQVHSTSRRVPSAQAYPREHGLLDRCVRGTDRAESVASLGRYFNQDDGAPRYTGRWFERFAGTGDQPVFADTVTECDVLALNFLGITDLADVAVDVTMTHAAEISALLAAIPSDLSMHEAPWEVYSEASAATQLWQLFKRCGGKDRWVTANKLLARKRPRLLPVYDSRVKAVLGQPDSIWACLWTWFHADGARAAAVADLRAEAGDVDDISLLRCLDVVLWMRANSSSPTAA